MKKFTFSAFLILVMLLSLCAVGQAQPTKEGKAAILFTFEGLSNLGTTPYNGGIGLKYYITNRIALRGSLGGSFVKADAKSRFATNTIASAGITTDVFGTENTNAYIGGEILFNHFDPIYEPVYEPVINTYGIGCVFGGEFFPWKNVSLGTEYKIVLDQDSQADHTMISLGKNFANFTLAIYFK